MQVDVMPVGWISRKEACEQLSISSKTVEKWVADRKIVSKLQRRTGRPPVRIFEEADVVRLAIERDRDPQPPEKREDVPSSEGWISTASAKQFLLTSSRSLDRLVERNQLATRLEGGKRVYRVSDLESIRDQRQKFLFAAPVPIKQTAMLAHQREPSITIERERLAFEREQWEAVQKRLDVETAARHLRSLDWLSPHQCARLKGLPSKLIVELAEGGKIAALRCGRSWRIRRASLEAFSG